MFGRPTWGMLHIVLVNVRLKKPSKTSSQVLQQVNLQKERSTYLDGRVKLGMMTSRPNIMGEEPIYVRNLPRSRDHSSRTHQKDIIVNRKGREPLDKPRKGEEDRSLLPLFSGHSSHTCDCS